MNRNYTYVFDRDTRRAKEIKYLINFLDDSIVEIALYENWRETIGKNRIDAVYIGSGYSDEENTALTSALRDLYPDVVIEYLK